MTLLADEAWHVAETAPAEDPSGTTLAWSRPVIEGPDHGRSASASEGMERAGGGYRGGAHGLLGDVTISGLRHQTSGYAIDGVQPGRRLDGEDGVGHLGRSVPPRLDRGREEGRRARRALWIWRWRGRSVWSPGRDGAPGDEGSGHAVWRGRMAGSA